MTPTTERTEDGANAMPGDRPSFRAALVSFLLPVIGLVVYLATRKTQPLQARSAGRGAALGFFLCYLPFFSFFAVGLRSRESGGRSPSNACRSNLKQLAIGTIQFTQDHNDKFPDLSSPMKFHAAIWPYVKNESVFSCPSNQLRYRGNRSLSKKHLGELDEPGNIILFYETEAVHDGYRAVCYADGHVKMIREEIWQKQKPASDIR